MTEDLKFQLCLVHADVDFFPQHDIPTIDTSGLR